MPVSKKPSPQNNNVFKTIVRDVVREELVPVEKRLGNKIQVLENRMDSLEDRIDKVEDNVKNTFTEYIDKVLTGQDQIMGELELIRNEQMGHYGQHEDLHSLPERVKDLELLHPQGRRSD